MSVPIKFLARKESITSRSRGSHVPGNSDDAGCKAVCFAKGRGDRLPDRREPRFRDPNQPL